MVDMSGADVELLKPYQVEDETNEWRLKFVGALNGMYLVAQIVIAEQHNSLAFLSDAFYNMTGLFASMVALFARHQSKLSRSETLTYGWRRVAVLGDVMSSVFHLALCFYIALESIPRLINPPKIDASWTFISIASAGIPVNLTRIFLFSGIGDEVMAALWKGGKSKQGPNGPGGDLTPPEHIQYFSVLTSGLVVGILLLMNGYNEHDDQGNEDEYASCMDTNDCNWTDWLDTCTSLVIVGVIVYSHVPVLLGGNRVLMQSTPKNFFSYALLADLDQIKGVTGVRDLHCWQLGVGDRPILVATVHLSLAVAAKADPERGEVMRKAKEVFHRHGVHSSTVQVEVSDGFPRVGLCQVECDREVNTNCCPKEFVAQKREGEATLLDPHLETVAEDTEAEEVEAAEEPVRQH